MLWYRWKAGQGPDRLSLGMLGERLTVAGEERRAGNAPMVARETFAGFVYAKGSWVLHMLRELLGEETFLRAVRSYLRHFAYRTADTQEFQRAVEDATGHRLWLVLPAMGLHGRASGGHCGTVMGRRYGDSAARDRPAELR